jgi:hypothetical protein
MIKHKYTDLGTHQYSVGLIYRPAMRHLLEKMAFEVTTSRYREIKFFLSSVFLVEAPEYAIDVINKWVKEINK